MLRTRFRTVALTTTLVGSSTYLLYTVLYPRASKAPSPAAEETFKAWVRPDAKTKEMRTFPLLPPATIQSFLTSHVRSSSLVLSGKKWSWNVVQVPSNDPMEDTHAEMVIARGEGSRDARAKGELMFFAVMDGHAGPWTSRLLSKTLIPTVMIEMDALIKGNPSPLLPPNSTLAKMPSLLPSVFKPDGSSSPSSVAETLKRAYTQLDKTIISSPLAILDLPPEKRGDAVRALIRPALSGSCALLALIDTHHEEVHVALVGDCRAVAGYYDPAEKRWIAEVLSEDQTGKAIAEIERLKKEHPGEEEQVAKNGRILGGLEPSRAFGDARYKWTADEQERLRELVTPPDRLVTPPQYKTPPYVSAEPVVTHRAFTLPSSPSTPKSGSSSSPAPTLRFLILATDGLWDELDPLQAVSIASTHLSRQNPSFPSSSVPPVLGTAGVEGKGEWRTSQGNKKHEWVFDERDPPAVSLVRNALGGSDERVRRALSLRAPWSRRERDDMTVTVVWWEEALPESDKPVTAKL